MKYRLKVSSLDQFGSQEAIRTLKAVCCSVLSVILIRQQLLQQQSRLRALVVLWLELTMFQTSGRLPVAGIRILSIGEETL